ncbi:ABC transporter substrate-binding protein [Streptomyces abyssalis]|uniref:ABC transporter substrate-binding protein n=1 Tax=Streptomyces abyssalis TaxID=933944 RepID=A0A1E7JJP7_9ACTN|nr:sugar ABC transporter substrate-binding protein [Streptomyces abyssalis]OEU87339.1 ABC transporter substrate-binding protein [Streptomyces abyssalis]OEU87870.1 ABC transporter substrate-binding protein [Streptomyces abyssalis]
MQPIPRIAAATAATTALALLLSACGSGGGEQTSAKDKQTLTVWGMGEEGKHLAKLGKEFNKKHPNITVKVTPVGWDVVHQKLVSAVAAGELPDMAQMGSTMLGEFIELDALDTVDQKTFKKDDYFPAAWNGGVKDGEAYGVPWYVDTRALYYRTDLAEKAGVDKPPATWKDQMDLAEAYKDKAKTKWGTYNQPANIGTWQTWVPFLFSAGGELLDSSGKPALDSPESVKALEEYAAYFDQGLSRKSSPPDYDVVKDFGSGDAPMFISGPWIVNNIKDQQPQLKGKYATAPLPAGESSTSWVGGASLVTFKDSEHKAAAKEFTKYLTSTEQQAHWYEIAKSLPAKEAAWDEPALKNAPEQLDAFEKQLKTAKTVPPLAKWEEFSAKIDEGVARVSQKGESPKKAAAWMQKATEGLVG